MVNQWWEGALYNRMKANDSVTNVSRKTSDQELFNSVTSVIAEWDQAGQGQPDYAVSFDCLEKVASLRSFYGKTLAKMIPSFKGSVGCDLGCWIGCSSLLSYPLELGVSMGSRVNLPLQIGPRHGVSRRVFTGYVFARFFRG